MLLCLSHPQVTIVETGKFNILGIGIVNKDFHINMMPGWDEDSVNVGYHTDDRNIFRSTRDPDRGIDTNGMETCQQDKTFERTAVDAYSTFQIRNRGEGGLNYRPLNILGLLKNIYISFGSFNFTRFITRLIAY